ncbi:30S ribosomal protein S9 [bacterium]|nr:30S ribosomal protein S9 [bacterium]
MSTDSQNPEQPQDDATPEAPEVTAEETISEPEVPAVVEPAEPEVPSVEAAEPSISSGLEIGSESIEKVDESEMVPQSDPVIRGKVDRYGVAWGTGRRKTAVARVRLKEGTGQFLINGRSLEEYFPVIRDQKLIAGPLEACEVNGQVDITVNVRGGGPTGQTGAVVLGIARALQAKDPGLHHILSGGGFLTRDGRMVERKKYGFKKARKSFQFSKR